MTTGHDETVCRLACPVVCRQLLTNDNLLVYNAGNYRKTIIARWI